MYRTVTQPGHSQTFPVILSLPSLAMKMLDVSPELPTTESLILWGRLRKWTYAGKYLHFSLGTPSPHWIQTLFSHLWRSLPSPAQDMGMWPNRGKSDSLPWKLESWAVWHKNKKCWSWVILTRMPWRETPLIPRSRSLDMPCFLAFQRHNCSTLLYFSELFHDSVIHLFFTYINQSRFLPFATQTPSN